uniref:Apple domain-containing protein n=1 Tax=viral metagenome TaxID=1070528 RepID=A0A6C0DG49_9ZZZZ
MAQQSGILTLENLQKEYDNTMILYIQAQENYNSALNSVDKKKYITIPGQTYWGTGAIQQQTDSSINDCTALCSNDVNCNGATFDSKDNTCWTRTGVSSLTTGTTTQTAIISDVTNAALNLQSLNDKLLLLNKQITDFKFENENTTPLEQTKINTTINENSTDMKDQYDILLSDRKKIKDILDEYFKISADKQNMEIYNTQNRIYYGLWGYLAFIFIIIVVKMVIYPELNIKWSSFIFYTILFAVLLLLVHFLKSVNIFFIFILIILIASVIMSFFN